MATEERETAGLISSDKVEGTNVYGATGEKIGSIERVMIDKRNGHVAYAVLRFGGFLGIGSDYYPIPWASLNYDTSLGGYRTNITEQQLQGAPKYAGNSWDWGRSRAWPQGLRLLRCAVERILIARWPAPDHRTHGQKGREGGGDFEPSRLRGREDDDRHDHRHERAGQAMNNVTVWEKQ